MMPDEPKPARPPDILAEPVASCDVETWIPLNKWRSANTEVRTAVMLEERAKALLPSMSRFPGHLFAVSPWEVDEQHPKLMQMPNKQLINAISARCTVVAYRAKPMEGVAG